MSEPKRFSYSGPIIWIHIEPSCSRDYTRLAAMAFDTKTDDPSLVIDLTPICGQYPRGSIAIGGIGELQLEVAVCRIRDRACFDIIIGQPIVVYAWDNDVGVEYEPIMQLAVEVVNNYNGHVVAYLDDIGAIISSNDKYPDCDIIVAQVPLARIIGCARTLCQISRGRAKVHIRPLEYLQRGTFKGKQRWI